MLVGTIPNFPGLTDWVAAPEEAAARDCLRRHYGISDDDITGSYEDISEVKPSDVQVYLDDDDYDDECDPPTAADIMAGKTKPFLVCSTAR